ncbi:WD40-repeat-containing domain protein [Aspergillus venezuelensis]
MGRDPFTRYSSSPALLGSDDPSMIKESEELLSRFMSGQSQEALHTNKQTRDRQATPVATTDKQQSDRPRLKIPRGNVQIRPKVGPRPQTGLERAPEPLKGNPQQKVAPSVFKGKLNSLHQRRRSQSSSSDDMRTTIRRSGRSRAEPTNYYKKLSIFDGESEDDEVQVIEKKPTSRSRSLSRTQCKIALSSGHLATTTKRIKQRFTPVNNSIYKRELGRYSNSRCQLNVTGEMTLVKTWKGASNDVVSLAWSPDGTQFAAGATAQCDEHMMAYNRKNNLVLGDLVTNELHELPDHWIERPRERESASHVVNDPRLFMSVTAVQFFEDALYTASYDHTVKIWDLSKGKPACYKTLTHNSKVIVMARSNFNNNLLATGAGSIGYWDIEQSQYTALDLPRARSRKDIDLIPTSTAWGTNHAVKEYLIAGMSEKEDGIAQHGLLAAFRFGETTVTAEHFSPNSQNIFDVAWHPVLPIFATACTAGQQASRGIRSVVNLYEPMKLKSRVLEFECPALDMNQVVFCPFNNNYISASCTDGVTYVWDLRNSGQILHMLKHGEPLNQLDETMPREQVDTGVNMQLWGNSYDQLFTGASDGMVKRWNILHAPKDALVEDVACVKEGIMSGAFSPDKTNLLIGDVSGALHLLSNSPFYPDKTLSHGFMFKESSCVVEDKTDIESGVMAAYDLIASGQIERHPFYGPGQGPHYEGPFAAWARPRGTPVEKLSSTPLEDKYEIRQLNGCSPKYRDGLTLGQQEDVERHITLAVMRNQRRGSNKRRIPEPKIKAEPLDEIVDLCSDEEEEVLPKRRQPVFQSNLPWANFEIVKAEVIDLTGDSDTESNPASIFAALESPTTEDLEDDFWWPESRTIDANFSEQMEC